jgi:hypothetical protein
MTIAELYLYVAKSYKNHEPSEFDGELWQLVFAGYDVETIKKAALFWKASSAQSQFMPTAQQLLEIINPSKKTLNADAAWSAAIKAGDEGATVVWTKRTQQAFLSAALPLLSMGDKVGARMAFKGAYDALHGGDEYIVSIGQDVDGRATATEQAVIENKITALHACAMGLPLSDDALRHAVKTEQLSWSQAGALRLNQNFNVLSLTTQAGDTPEKLGAVAAIKAFLKKKPAFVSIQ